MRGVLGVARSKNPGEQHPQELKPCHALGLIATAAIAFMICTVCSC